MRWPMVGICASASSWEDLVELISALPDPTGQTIFVALQQDCSLQRPLEDLLVERHRGLILQVVDKAQVHRDCIYIVPARHVVTLAGGSMSVREYVPGAFAEDPVDTLFAEIAEAAGSDSVGVILAGWGEEGIQGIREIKHAGGRVFVQEPRSANLKQRCHLAISTGCVDQALTPPEIARKLAQAAYAASDTASTRDDLLSLQLLGESEYLTRREEVDSMRHLEWRASRAPPASNARRVLIIDDDHECLRYVEALAHAWGHNVQVADNRGLALHSARTFHPHVILLNPDISNCDGFELARELRNDPRMTLAVLVALVREAAEAGTPRAGFHASIAKDATLTRLRQLLADPEAETRMKLNG